MSLFFFSKLENRRAKQVLSGVGTSGGEVRKGCRRVQILCAHVYKLKK
jgi:hypothetical protein